MTPTGLDAIASPPFPAPLAGVPALLLAEGPPGPEWGRFLSELARIYFSEKQFFSGIANFKNQTNIRLKNVFTFIETWTSILLSKINEMKKIVLNENKMEEFSFQKEIP